MKEIEILVDFDNTKEEALEILSKFSFIEEKEVHDTYYEDPLRDNLKPKDNLRINELFRIRRKGEDCYITYKKNHFEGNRWIYSDEYETKAENYEMVENVAKMLGLEEQVVVHNKRRFYHYEDYEITLEEVLDLGLFLEVEKVVPESETDVLKIKGEIHEFIKGLGFRNVRELDLGKNQLMLRNKLHREDVDIYIHEKEC